MSDDDDDEHAVVPPPLEPPSGDELRAKVNAAYAALDVEEEHSAEQIEAAFAAEVADAVTTVASVPLDAVQFVSERRHDERVQQAEGAAAAHAAGNAHIRNLERQAMARVRDEAASKRKRVEGMETQLGKKEVSIAAQLTRPQTVEPKPWPTRRLGRPASCTRRSARCARRSTRLCRCASWTSSRTSARQRGPGRSLS